ncbi:glutathione S-transferase family protein [Halovulum dunhuangense]|uniref:Glutathione S-transferase family protein n=1 Tax=Halovulum dunhuangense TaxID=1505036 RepID=A0A849L1H6_9RHOB|nr:glutathione S-transferase family protein [Halovulum dunhuangense]NNU80158.1 glutathione S-transferase family protein [Halovulum dunhuangense]
MIVLHGRNDSTNVQKVLWLFDELGLEYERIDRGASFGGLDTPEYKALNPNSRVPTIEHDGLVMWESHAILRHYARLHPKAGMLPSDPADMLRVDMALDWNHLVLWAGFRLAYLKLATGQAEKGDPAVTAELEAGARNFAGFEWLLGDRPHVGGAAFSIGDIPLAVSVHRYLWMGGSLENWPKVQAWHERVSARPAYAARMIARAS